MSAREMTVGDLRKLIAPMDDGVPVRVLPGWPMVDRGTGICPATVPASAYYTREDTGAHLVLVPEGLASEMLAILAEEEDETAG